MTPAQKAMADLLDKHVASEMNGDLDGTMSTMTENPHLTNVAVLMGGYGEKGVRDFYRNHLVGKFFPPDVTMTAVSRTIGDTQVVDELVIRFTHTQAVDWMLPGVPPTGKSVEVAVVVIAGFQNGKISHEHIYWDQAGVLAQVGLLDPTGLPVSRDGAQRVLDPKKSRSEISTVKKDFYRKTA